MDFIDIIRPDRVSQEDYERAIALAKTLPTQIQQRAAVTLIELFEKKAEGLFREPPRGLIRKKFWLVGQHLKFVDPYFTLRRRFRRWRIDSIKKVLNVLRGDFGHGGM
jgi:hypothetical protein